MGSFDWVMIRMYKVLLGLILLVAWIGQPLMAVTSHARVDQLYTMTMPVQDRNPSTWQLAANTAFRHLLVRVSGNLYVNTIPDIQQSLAKAKQFISRFSYQEEDQHLQLTLVFDQQQVNQLLIKSGQRLWLQARPDVLWWAAYQAPDESFLMLNDNQGLTGVMQQASTDRGIHLVMPMMDLPDRATVEPVDVWQLRQTMVWDASRRYGHVDVVMGKVFQSDQAMMPWEGIWYWRPSGASTRQVIAFQTYGVRPEQVLANAVNWVADQMASHGAMLNSRYHFDMIKTTVDGINNLTTYQQLLQLLKADARVIAVQVVALDDHAVQLLLRVHGGRSALQAVVKSNPHLQMASPPSDGAVLLQWVSPQPLPAAS